MRDRRFTAYLHFRLVICLYSAFMGMDKCKAPQFAVPAEFPLFESRATPECIYALNDVCGCGRQGVRVDPLLERPQADVKLGICARIVFDRCRHRLAIQDQSASQVVRGCE